MKTKQFFSIIDFDGWNVGLKGSDFTASFLVFDSFEHCEQIANWWDVWILGGDV